MSYHRGLITDDVNLRYTQGPQHQRQPNSGAQGATGRHSKPSMRRLSSETSLGATLAKLGVCKTARYRQQRQQTDLARSPESRHREDLLCLRRRGFYAYVLNRQVGMQSAKQVGMQSAKALCAISVSPSFDIFPPRPCCANKPLQSGQTGSASAPWAPCWCSTCMPVCSLLRNVPRHLAMHIQPERATRWPALSAWTF
jgi:hypothetical protein